MRVTITRFRTYTETFVCDFKDNELVLLMGNSGSGKSTILEAITWCLYGGIRNVYPRGRTANSSKPTIVRIEDQDIVIRRSHPPAVIEVSYNGETYSSDSASRFIARRYGPENLWFCISYISQGKYNPLMLGSTAEEKMEILRLLTFGSQNEGDENTPEYYTAKLDNRYEKVSSQIKEIQVALENMRIGLETLSKKYTREYEEASKVNTQQSTKISDDMKESAAELSKLQILLETAIKHESLNMQWASTLCLFEKDLADINAHLLPDLNTLFAERKKVDKAISSCEIDAKRAQLKQQLAKLKVYPEHLSMDTSQISLVLKEQINIYEQYGKQFKTPHDIENHNKSLQNKLESQKVIKAAYDQWEDQYETAKKQHKKLVDAYNVELREVSLVQQLNAALKSKNDASHKDYQCQVSLYEQRKIVLDAMTNHAAEIKKLDDELKEIDEHHKELVSWYESNCKDRPIGDIVASLKAITHELKCPHCTMSVVYKNGTLSKGSYSKEQADDALSCLENIKLKHKYDSQRKELLTKRNALQYELDKCNIQIKSLPSEIPVHPVMETYKHVVNPTPVTPFKFDIKQPEKPANVTSLISMLNLIDTKGIPSCTLSDAHERLKSIETVPFYKHIVQQLADLGDEVNVSIPISNLRDTLRSIDKEINKQRELQSRKQALEKQIANHLNFKPEAVTQTSIELKANIEKLKVAREELIRVKRSIDLYEVYQEDLKRYNGYCDAYKQLSTELGYILKLKETVVKVSTGAMECVIDGINTQLSKIVPLIFKDSDTKVCLKTIKTLKTKDKQKFQVNLAIYHKGSEYDSSNYLSGGEQSRLSFALTIAAASISESPVLILDECLNNIDQDTRERCIEALRELVSNKIVINVCHNSVAGSHDSIVSLE
jgi:DNA repair exonuclease SbcCD ATPase subunit